MVEQFPIRANVRESIVLNALQMNVAPIPPTAQAIACLTAIGRFHALDVSEGQLAHLAAGAEITRPAELVRLAQKIGLSAKAARLSWGGLRRLGAALPAILVLRGGGAVILSGIREAEDKIDVVIRAPAAPEKGFQFWDRADPGAELGG